jgi:hypothetical protein
LTNVHIKFWTLLFRAGWQESMLKAALDKIAETPGVPDENDQLGDLEVEDREEEAHDDDESVDAAVEG